jgi:hypothetical protein
LFIKTNITSRRIYTRVFVSTWLYLLYNLSEVRRIKIETNICSEKMLWPIKRNMRISRFAFIGFEAKL